MRLSVRALAALFRGKFLAGLAQMLDAGELHLPDLELQIPANRARWFSLLYSKRWVLYAKRPFGGPKQVLSYLANYTHRVALSNRRIVAVGAASERIKPRTFVYEIPECTVRPCGSHLVRNSVQCGSDMEVNFFF